MARELFDALMQGRENKRESKEKKTGRKQEGGIFDVVFRGRKNRENEIDALKKELDE